MKPEIHPEYKDVKVVCSCGNTFVTLSTLGKEQLSLEVCAACHPFYTGTQKIMDTAGRVDRFRQKYGMKGKAAAAPEVKADKKDKDKEKDKE
jgi:large subunit ribosomal protein L31